MSNTVWTPENGWHDGPTVDNAELVERFTRQRHNPYAECRAYTYTYAADDWHATGIACTHEGCQWASDDDTTSPLIDQWREHALALS